MLSSEAVMYDVLHNTGSVQEWGKCLHWHLWDGEIYCKKLRCQHFPTYIQNLYLNVDQTTWIQF